MKTKINLLILFLALITTLLHSQTTPQFQWVKGGGSMATSWQQTAMESARWLGTDAHGNIYGMSSLFGLNTKIDTSIRPTGFGYDDFAVFSYNCEGNLRWVKYFGSKSQDLTGGYTVDMQGNSYVSGYVALNYDWLTDGYFGDTTVIATPNMTCGNFISKLDSNGHTVWLKLLGNAQNDLVIRLINQENDNQGNPCLVIKFVQTGMWGGYTIPEKGYYVIRVNKNNGNIIEVTKLDFNATDQLSLAAFYMSIDEMNNYYLNVQVRTDTVYIGSNIVTADFIGIYQEANSILVKYSPSGSLLWYKELGGLFPNNTEKLLYGKPIIVNDFVYINGRSQNHNSIFGDTINNPYIDTPSRIIPFNARFDKNNGNFISLKHLLNTEYAARESVTTISDKIYLANLSLGKVLLSPTDTIKPYGGEYSKAYPFIIAMDTNHSQFEWGIATKVTGDYTRIEALTVDLAGNIYAGGQVTDSIYDSFGGSYRAIGGESDFFIAKIATANNCGCIKSQPYPQLLGINNKTITVKGMATGIPDSLYWMWSDGSKTIYTNPNTNITHTYATGGNYTVCLHTYNYCGTKDSCFVVNGVGITEQELKYLNAYPNPVTNSLTIENPYQCSMQLNIYSIAGKLLYSNKYENYTTSIDMSNYEKGIYFVEMILADGRKAVRKVVRS
jgi:hypothetical protein